MSSAWCSTISLVPLLAGLLGATTKCTAVIFEPTMESQKQRSVVLTKLLATGVIQHRVGTNKHPFGDAEGIGFVTAFVSDLAHAHGFHRDFDAVRKAVLQVSGHPGTRKPQVLSNKSADTAASKKVVRLKDLVVLLIQKDREVCSMNAAFLVPLT